MNVLQDLKSHQDFSIEEMDKLVFDKHCAQEGSLVALYLSVIELSQSLLELYKSHKITGTASIFRTMLEAFVDMVNLSEDRTYASRMEAADNEQWLKMLIEAEKGENQYCISLTQLPNFDEQLASYKELQKQSRKNRLAPLSIADRFIKAGMEDEYRGLYNGLCREGHNNISALVSRHIEINESETDLQLVLNKNSNDGSYDHYITTTSCFLLKAGILVHRLLKTRAAEMFEKRLDKFLCDESEHFGLTKPSI